MSLSDDSNPRSARHSGEATSAIDRGSPVGLAVVVILLSCVAACRTSPTATPAGPPHTVPDIRAQFLAAMRRVRQHEVEPTDSLELKRYGIYDYLLAARLQRDLELQPDEALDGRIDSFLQTRGALPVARNLRTQWLSSLATRHRWELFLSRVGQPTNPTLSCDRLQARLATGATDGLGEEALARWLLPQNQPAECEVIFSWLRTQNLLTAPLAESRARAALVAANTRLAREALADVPEDRAAALFEWIHLLETPKSALERLARSPTVAVEFDALAAGFNRLANSDSDSATKLLPRLLARADITPSTSNRLKRLAALGAAYSRRPDSLAVFRALPAEVNDAEVQEWRARAAILAGDYAQARAWIEQMPAELAAQPRWRYWRARAIGATGSAQDAAPILAELAQLRDFYGYLAADLMNQPYRLNAEALPVDAAEQAALAAEPGLSRAHELFDCDMSDAASAEWAAVLNHTAPLTKVQGAQLATSWGWYAQAITTLAQSGQWNDVRLRYPRPFTAAVAAASQLTQVPEDWILAIMRQESLFHHTAVSHAGARGLMQVQPATAAAVTLRWHLPTPDTNGIFDPTPDIEVGAAYLHDLLDRFHGQLAPSLAAYNAGPRAVRRWIPAGRVDADVWIENIPYGETRSYIQHVCEHIVAYAWVRGVEPARLAILLRPVQLAPGDAPGGSP